MLYYIIIKVNLLELIVFLISHKIPFLHQLLIKCYDPIDNDLGIINSHTYNSPAVKTPLQRYGELMTDREL